jgi:hypothetical protein
MTMPVSRQLAAALAGAAVAVLVGVAPAGAQMPVPESVTEVRIAVWDPETQFEQQQVIAGDPIQLIVGEPVMLRLFQPSTGAQDRFYLGGTFSIQAGEGMLELSQHDPRRGMVVVRALEPQRPGDLQRQLSLRYELADGTPVERMHLSRGVIPLEITEPPSAPPAAQARALVGSLYRGILMREPDSEGLEHYGRLVAEGGLAAVAQVATELAQSQESQVAIYERTCNEQRLVALYAELLGRRAEQIDAESFRAHLARLQQGQIAQVVTGMVRSAEFRQTQLGEPQGFRGRPRRQ